MNTLSWFWIRRERAATRFTRGVDFIVRSETFSYIMEKRERPLHKSPWMFYIIFQRHVPTYIQTFISVVDADACFNVSRTSNKQWALFCVYNVVPPDVLPKNSNIVIFFFFLTSSAGNMILLSTSNSLLVVLSIFIKSIGYNVMIYEW